MELFKPITMKQKQSQNENITSVENTTSVDYVFSWIMSSVYGFIAASKTIKSLSAQNENNCTSTELEFGLWGTTTA